MSQPRTKGRRVSGPGFTAIACGPGMSDADRQHIEDFAQKLPHLKKWEKAGTMVKDIKREDLPAKPILRSEAMELPLSVRVEKAVFPAYAGGRHFHIGIRDDDDYFWLEDASQPNGVWCRTFGFPKRRVSANTIVDTEEQADGYIRAILEHLRRVHGEVEARWTGSRGALEHPPRIYDPKAPRLVPVWGPDMADIGQVKVGDLVYMDDDGDRGYPTPQANAHPEPLGRCKAILALVLRPVDEKDPSHFAVLED